MKKNISLFTGLLKLLVMLNLLGCSSPTSTNSTDIESSASDAQSQAHPDENQASCIWDNTAVRDSPSDKGKYLAGISIGEIVLFIPEIDTANKYVKLKLNDGTLGWSKKEFVIINSTPAVFARDADIYSRPDPLTRTDKKFAKYDIVAISNAQADFVEVKGKRSDGKWIEAGWVKKSNLINSKLDIATAKFIKKGLAATNDEDKVRALESILNNPDLSGSSFLADLPEMLSFLRENSDSSNPVDSTAAM